MPDMRERWALILGASSGFGEATALALAAAGYNICGVHLDRRQAMAHVEEIKSKKERSIKEQDFEGIVAAILKREELGSTGIVNPSYECGDIVRVKRDKAKVEVAVQIVERWILAVLRKRVHVAHAVDDAGHELRTPITVIRGQLELLSDDPKERKATIFITFRAPSLIFPEAKLRRYGTGSVIHFMKRLQCQTTTLPIWSMSGILATVARRVV